MSTPGWLDKEHDRYGAGKKSYVAICTGVKVVRGIGRGLSDHHVVLRKVSLVGKWIKRREVVNGARRVRN